VDFVIEWRRKLLAVEVNAGETPTYRDTSALRLFLNEYGTRALGGLVLHAGTRRSGPRRECSLSRGGASCSPPQSAPSPLPLAAPSPIFCAPLFADLPSRAPSRAAMPSLRQHPVPPPAGRGELQEALASGDAAAFERAFRAHAPSLYGFACRLTGSRATADDVVQEAFAEAWHSGRAWRSDRDLRAFLYTVARTRALMRRRHERIVDREASNAQFALYPTGHSIPAVDAAVEHGELRDAVQSAVNSLPDRTRLVVLLTRFSGLTQPEVARVLRLSVRTVEWHLARAVSLLRVPLRGHWPLAVLAGAALVVVRGGG
jgi:RNA polymerase sigma-70 factor (ECF subfamily)